MSRLVVSASALSLLVGPVWKGVLVMGTNRTDLCLQAVERGFHRLSGDHTAVWSSGGCLYAAAAEPLPGLSRTVTRLHLVALVQGEGPQAPPDEVTSLLGHALPTVRLNPTQPSGMAALITRLRQA